MRGFPGGRATRWRGARRALRGIATSPSFSGRSRFAMESPRIYFVGIGGAVRGPLTSEDLRDLATAEVVTRETEIAASAAGPWARLATLSLVDEVFPPRRVLGFKAAEFENRNPSGGAAIHVDDVIAQANRASPALRGREVVVHATGGRGTPVDAPANEVQVIVHAVGRKLAEHAGPIALPPPIVAFPRWRWFAVASAVGSAGMLAIPLCYRLPYDSMTVAILSAWVAMFNALLFGVMVMDRQMTGAVRPNKSKLEKRK